MKHSLFSKFTSLVLALLMVITMVPVFTLTASAAETTATLSFSSVDNRTSYSTTQQVWEQNGIKLTNDKASSTSDVNNSVAPVRFYAKSKVTIECSGNITKIVANCNSTTYATALKNSIPSTDSVTVSSKVVTITPSSSAQAYTITLTAQVRLDSIEVTYETSGGSDPDCVHDWEQTVSKAATCTEDGYNEYKCSKCSETKKETTDAALGHDEVNHDAQAASCTAVGWDAYVTCSRCDYTTYVEIPKVPHNFVDGICTECEAAQPITLTINRDSFGSASGYAWHDWSVTATTGQTITGSGYIYGTTTSSIQMNSGKTGKHIYNTVALPGKIVSITLTAAESGTPRDFYVLTSDTAFNSADNPDTTGATAKKVTTDGVTWEFDPTGHYFAIVVTGGAAYLSSIEIAYEPCSHENTTAVSQKDPTCTESGREAGRTCVDCGTYTEGGAVIPATGHSWGETECTVCHTKLYTIPEVLASDDGTAVVVCGTVKAIDSYNSVTIFDADGNELFVYKLTTTVEVGDIIRVTGTKTTYKEILEIDQGATAEIIGHAPVLTSVALSLNKGVTVNVKFTIPEAWLAKNAGAKVVFSNNVELPAKAGVNTYSVDLTPGQINDNLTVAIRLADDTIVGEAKDVSVVAYMTKLKVAYDSGELGFTEAKYTALQNLLDAALTYSNVADGKTYANFTGAFADVEAATITNSGVLTGFAGDLGTYATIKISVNPEKVDGEYMDLSMTGLSLYGVKLSDYLSENNQIVISGLYPANFDDQIKIILTYDPTMVTFTFNSYLKAVFEATESGSVKSMAYATYLYGRAAEAYLDAQ